VLQSAEAECNRKRDTMSRACCRPGAAGTSVRSKVSSLCWTGSCTGLPSITWQPQPPGHTLQTTALVNEAYLRLIDAKRASWNDRSHFLAACSQIMRRVLVDHARGRQAAKRGGGAPVAPLEEAWVVSPEPSTDIVAVDKALSALAKVDPRKARVVELRFFRGLSVEGDRCCVGDLRGERDAGLEAGKSLVGTQAEQ